MIIEARSDPAATGVVLGFAGEGVAGVVGAGGGVLAAAGEESSVPEFDESEFEVCDELFELEFEEFCCALGVLSALDCGACCC
jgi:hypothetical protein